MAETIKPTPGRIVHYYPAQTTNYPRVGNGALADPLAGIIVGVWSDTCVTVAFWDANGLPFRASGVLLVQGDAPRPDGNYCVWPTREGAVTVEMTQAKRRKPPQESPEQDLATLPPAAIETPNFPPVSETTDLKGPPPLTAQSKVVDKRLVPLEKVKAK